MRAQRFLAALAAGVTLLLSLGGTALASHDDGGDLLPDLRTRTPRDLYIETTSGGERRLRFRNEVSNYHTGPLEIFPEGADSGDCDGDGSSSNDRVVYQRIYQDRNGDGYFTRGRDTQSTTRRAGCNVFHPSHDHWHFDAFSSYHLTDLSGNLVRQGGKQSFCIEDYWRPYPSMDGSPEEEYYNDCESSSALNGISVGWSDVYRNFLPGQYVVITGLRDGDYCLWSETDPEGLIRETNEGNNLAAVRVRINGRSVWSVSGSCASPTSATPTPTRTPTPSPTPGTSPTPAPSATPGASPTPAPPSGGTSLIVYDDTLRWRNWSWRTSIDFASTSQVHSGARSISVTYTAGWGALSLHTSDFQSGPYERVHFWLHAGGSTLPSIDILLYDANDRALPYRDMEDYATSAGGGWYEVSIPLSALGGTDRTISGVELKEGLGRAQPTFYVDDLRFE